MRELIKLNAVALEQHDITAALNEISRIAVRAVPNADGASVTTFDDGRPSAVAASDQWAKELDELQYAEHEGPCLDCWRTGNVYRVRDLAEEGRWPFYAPRAVAQGARSSLSLPMAAEGKLIGALNLYSKQPDAFDAEASRSARSSRPTPGSRRRSPPPSTPTATSPTSCARPCSRGRSSSRPRASSW
jgi:GAF domain-containing protein